jgi:hypothetical protein
MTRVSALAVLFCAAMTLAVTEVNAQCASCSQTTPVFAQSYTPAPTVVGYPTPMTYTAAPAPVAQGCTSCAPVTQTYTSAPVAQDCCGGSVVTAPMTTVPAPVSVAAPSNGCCAPAPTTCCAQPVTNCCDPCAGNTRVSLRDRRMARRAARSSRGCCNTCCY